MRTHYVSFRKWPPKRGDLRIEVAVPAVSPQEARTIAEHEMAAHPGYRFQGCD